MKVKIRRTEINRSEDVRLDIAPQLLEDNCFQEMKQLDGIVNDITKTCAQVSQACNELCQEIATIGSKVGSCVSDYGVAQKNGKAVLAGAAIEFLTMAGAELYGSYKRRQIENEKKRKLAELLDLKQEIAREKLGWCQEQYDIFSQKTIFIDFFNKEFTSTITQGEEFGDKKIAGFKRSFAPYIKWRYNMDILQYLITEMQAWQKGKQTSRLKRPDWTIVLNKELEQWPGKLFPNNPDEGWENALNSALYETNKQLPIPIYLMLTEPYLLRNYVGVGVTGLFHCQKLDPLIDLSQEKPLSETAKQLLENNPYYLDMAHIAKMAPEELPSESVGSKDVLGAFCVAFVGVVLFLLVDHYMTGFWFFVVGSLLALFVGATLAGTSSMCTNAEKCLKYAEQLEEMTKEEKMSAKINNEITIK